MELETNVVEHLNDLVPSSEPLEYITVEGETFHLERLNDVDLWDPSVIVTDSARRIVGYVERFCNLFEITGTETELDGKFYENRHDAIMDVIASYE